MFCIIASKIPMEFSNYVLDDNINDYDVNTPHLTPFTLGELLPLQEQCHLLLVIVM